MASSQRMAAREREIAEIASGDVRVSIVGTVVDSDGAALSIDDGTGRIDVSFADAPAASIGQPVRVMGKVVSLDGGVEVQGEILQDFTGGDVRLWKKVSAMWEESLRTL